MLDPERSRGSHWIIANIYTNIPHLKEAHISSTILDQMYNLDKTTILDQMYTFVVLQLPSKISSGPPKTKPGPYICTSIIYPSFHFDILQKVFSGVTWSDPTQRYCHVTPGANGRPRDKQRTRLDLELKRGKLVFLTRANSKQSVVFGPRGECCGEGGGIGEGRETASLLGCLPGLGWPGLGYGRL